MTIEQRIPIPAKDLEALVARIFSAAGVPESSARTVAEGLVEADLEGTSSHGVMLVDMYVDRLRMGSVSPTATCTVVSDRGAAIVLDAGNALGHVSAEQAVALAVERAQRYGLGAVAVRHAFHFGAARRYALAAAEAGCIGIATCNTRPLMPAPGGAERAVGNNPIAIAVPTDGPIPLVLDMATSEAAMGKIRMAAKSGTPIPENWSVTADGMPTTDAAEAIAGMLLPVGGPKGFGLALMIDLLCGLLSGGATGADVQPLYGNPAVPYDCSHFFLAIDVAHFGDSATFHSRALAAAQRIRSERRAPGVAQLFTPGEPEWQTRVGCAGEVQLQPAVAAMLAKLAAQLGVSPSPLGTGSVHREDNQHAKT